MRDNTVWICGIDDVSIGRVRPILADVPVRYRIEPRLLSQIRCGQRVVVNVGGRGIAEGACVHRSKISRRPLVPVLRAGSVEGGGREVLQQR